MGAGLRWLEVSVRPLAILAALMSLAFAASAHAEQPVTNLFTTTVTQAEILFGLALLPEGRRRSNLLIAAEQMFAEDFADRLLAFDTPSAIEFATIAATRRRQGRPT